MPLRKTASRIKAAVYLQHMQPTASVNAGLNTLKLAVATQLLRVLPKTMQSNGVRQMNSFEKFLNCTSLQCQLIVAQADLRKQNAFGRALRYRDDMGEQYNTLNKRQSALHATGENIRQLNKKIRSLKAELQSTESTGVAA